MKVIFPAAVLACLLAAGTAVADEASSATSLQVIGPHQTRELATQTAGQVSAAAAEATRQAQAESAQAGDADSTTHTASTR
ncbi:MAG TPA: hypothetical protein VGB88_00485 [Alphaproteobacteria bacterium]